MVELHDKNRNGFDFLEMYTASGGNLQDLWIFYLFAFFYTSLLSYHTLTFYPTQSPHNTIITNLPIQFWNSAYPVHNIQITQKLTAWLKYDVGAWANILNLWM